MRYDLAYYKNIPQRDGDTIIRLEIYKKVGDRDMPLVNKEIGDVLTSLRLDIEGQGEDVDAPIVKTSLTFSVVDAPERNEAFIKCGDWEEFYTADATGWKVCLLGKRRNDSGFTMMWGGYVTPDSYTETLQYHGVVSITARDNIGHLQDFDYDAVGNGAGMITPYELINQAWEKIASPMRLDWRGEEDMNNWPQTEGVDAEQTYMNVAAFEGKTWYDAVTETLYAYGMVMRYTGRNSVSVCPLRRLPLQGRADYDYLPHVTPVFEAYATRELVPAVRNIEERVSYDLGEGKEAGVIAEDQFGSTYTYTTLSPNSAGDLVSKLVKVHPIANETELATGWGNEKNKTLFFNHFAYRAMMEESLADQVCIAMGLDNSPQRLIWYSQPIYGYNLKLKIERGAIFQLARNTILSTVNPYFLDAYSIKGSLNFTTAEGTEYYYDGKEWKTSSSSLELLFEDGVIEMDVLFPEALNVYGTLTLFITSIAPKWKIGGDFTADGPYVGLKLSFTKSNEQSLAEKNTVRTVYDEGNNVMLSRTPEIAPALNNVTFPVFIKNGIFRKNGDVYDPTPEWKWYDDEEDAAQLAVLVHKQLLAYYSKPNNLISGTIMNPHLLDPRVIWMWKGKEHFMQSGSFDYLDGVIDGATLREFKRYETMWQ